MTMQSLKYYHLVFGVTEGEIPYFMFSTSRTKLRLDDRLGDKVIQEKVLAGEAGIALFKRAVFAFGGSYSDIEYMSATSSTASAVIEIRDEFRHWPDIFDNLFLQSAIVRGTEVFYELIEFGGIMKPRTMLRWRYRGESNHKFTMESLFNSWSVTREEVLSIINRSILLDISVSHKRASISAAKATR